MERHASETLALLPVCFKLPPQCDTSHRHRPACRPPYVAHGATLTCRSCIAMLSCYSYHTLVRSACLSPGAESSCQLDLCSRSVREVQASQRHGDDRPVICWTPQLLFLAASIGLNAIAYKEMMEWGMPPPVLAGEAVCRTTTGSRADNGKW